MVEISKELFEAVIGEKVKYYSCCYNEIEYDCLSLDRHNPLIMEINYFFFKCKEWALSKGYYLSSNTHRKGGCCQIFMDSSRECCECGEIETFKFLHSPSEVEAVVSACEYLLDKIKKEKHNE